MAVTLSEKLEKLEGQHKRACSQLREALAAVDKLGGEAKGHKREAARTAEALAVARAEAQAAAQQGAKLQVRARPRGCVAWLLLLLLPQPHLAHLHTRTHSRLRTPTHTLTLTRRPSWPAPSRSWRRAVLQPRSSWRR